MSSGPSKSQDQPVPTPTDRATESGVESPAATVNGATKEDDRFLHFYINLVQEHIEKETNPVRQKNAQVCLEFVRQHGYPAQGYRFRVHCGTMEVLTVEEHRVRQDELLQQAGVSLKDDYGLVRCWPFSNALIVILFADSI